MSGSTFTICLLYTSDASDEEDSVEHGGRITLVGADSNNIAVTAGELVDLYKVIKVEPDIVVRSAAFLKLEAHASARIDCSFMHFGCFSPMCV